MPANAQTKDLIQISEMAELHGISRQTLILYDKNGLLKPAYTSENGYRYYSMRQVPRLRLICFLKEVGVPLAAIKEHLDTGLDPNDIYQLMETRRAAIDQQIAQLELQREYIDQRSETLRNMDVRRLNLDVPVFEWRPQRKAMYVPYPEDDMDPSKLHRTLMHTWSSLLEHGMIPSKGFGSLLRRDAIMSQNPLDGAGCLVFVPFPDQIREHEGDVAQLVTIPEGEYVTMYKQAMPYDVEPTRRLLRWVVEQGLEPVGDVVDLCLLDALFHGADEGDFCRLEVRVQRSL